MQGRSQQIAPKGAQVVAARRGEIPLLALIGLIACALSIASASDAGEAETVAIAVTSATGVTTTSSIVAGLAALESAYADSDEPIEARVAEASSFDAFPRELASIGRATLTDEAGLPARTDASPPILMLERPKLGPLVMEQPMRVYENDVTVKLRAPGRRRSFATVEVTF